MRREVGDEALVDRALDDDPRARRTTFSVGRENHEDRGVRRTFVIGVVEEAPGQRVR